MGIHLSIYDNGKEVDHSAWDFTRHVGDDKAFTLLMDQEYETIGEGEDMMYRPENIEEYLHKLLLHIGDNTRRWVDLCALFKQSPNTYLHAGR